MNSNYVSANFNTSTIKFDQGQMTDISKRFEKIITTVESTMQHIDGVKNDSQAVWTGAAAEKFMSDCDQLMNKTKDLVQKMSTDKQNLDKAIEILRISQDKAKGLVSELSTNDTFIN